MRNYLAFIFVSQAGLSVSQLTLLKKQDVLVSSGGDMRILIAQHRKRDPYTIPMEHSFALTYSHYLELLKQEQQTSSYFFDELFFHANQKKILNSGLTQRSFEHIFKAISEVLKIEFTLKSLRQTCILRWVGNGVSLASIKEWLGVAPAYDISPFTHFVDSQLELCQSLKPLHELPIR
jgi:integrase